MIKEALRYYGKVAIKKSLMVFWVFPVRKNRITLLNELSYSYGDSLKYLHIYIRKRRSGKYQYIIPLKNRIERTEEDTIVVKPGTFKYYYYALTSRVIITNAGGISFLPKRKNQIFINTWHGGGPYKRTSTDVFSNFFYNKEVELNGKQIDYMFASCRYNAEYEYKSMMVADERCIKSGLPRNDIFFGNHKKIKLKVWDKYKLDEEARVVLFAPTFRINTDDSASRKFAVDLKLDPDRITAALRERFGGEWKFVVRLHPKLAGRLDFRMLDVIDMTSYPDMQELLYSVDVVITDYSSLMWDFALTGRPVFLFAEDIDEYAAKPGFYMSYDKWPYPLGRSQEELIDNIRAFDEEKYKEDLNKHFEESGSYEKGSACQSVLDILED